MNLAGEVGSEGSTRIMDLLVTVVGVQSVIDGLSPVIVTILEQAAH
jgi:small neutral amino acid transporter SnatA (MarC family)